MNSSVSMHLMNIDQVIPYQEALFKKLSKRRQQKVSRLTGYDKLLSIALGVLIDKVLGCDEDKDIVYSKSGRPHLQESQVDISFAHGGRYAGLAYSEERLGIDIELFQKTDPLIAKYYYTEEELKWVNEAKPDRRLLELWTRKESIMKADGRGLGTPKEELEVFRNARWNFETCAIDQHILSCACSESFALEVKMHYL